jgi:ATPase subunit of ABC transporter with duplicated ATPase domains
MQARTVLFSQHHMDQLNMDLSPLDYIQELFPTEKEGRIRGFLGHFGFDIKKVCANSRTP